MAMASSEDYISLLDSVTTDQSNTVPSLPETRSRSTRAVLHTPNAVDYWYGKRYFKYLMIQAIAKEADGNVPTEYLDSRLRYILGAYAYDEAVDELCLANELSFAIEHVVNSDRFTSLMVVLGMIERVGSSKDKKTVLELIEKIYAFTGDDTDDDGNEDDGNDDYDHAAAVSGSEQTRPRSTYSSIDSLVTRANDMIKVELGEYTTALKELADETGERLPVYRTKKDMRNPTQFHTTVMFMGLFAEGWGRKKQESKNNASKSMCERIYATTRRATP